MISDPKYPLHFSRAEIWAERKRLAAYNMCLLNFFLNEIISFRLKIGKLIAKKWGS